MLQCSSSVEQQRHLEAIVRNTEIYILQCMHVLVCALK